MVIKGKWSFWSVLVRQARRHTRAVGAAVRRAVDGKVSGAVKDDKGPATLRRAPPYLLVRCLHMAFECLAYPRLVSLWSVDRMISMNILGLVLELDWTGDWASQAAGQQHTGPLCARCEAHRPRKVAACEFGSCTARDAAMTSKGDNRL